MRKWLLILIMGVFFTFPAIAAYAQSNVTLANVNVQLWPEYDQPSMLVIVDFQVSISQLPANIPFRIPKEANLIAVAAYAADGSLVNAVFDGPKKDGEWQTFSISMDTSASYRFEYYQPITFNGSQRIFSYLWDGAYAVDAFNIRVLEPMDTVSLTTIPALPSTAQENGLLYYEGDTVKLAGGEQFTLNLDYKKTSDTLIAPPQGIQPSAPVDENTPGRISLNNSLPYVIGGLGVIMIVGGLVYYWGAGRNSGKKARRRTHSYAENKEDGAETHCPQCGQRANAGDRFCRVCGARLRHPEE
jgi:hypothetical protein